MPTFLPGAGEYWWGFHEFDADRVIVVGARPWYGPTSSLAIDAFARLLWRDDLDEQLLFRRCIRKMDAAARRWLNVDPENPDTDMLPR